MKNKHNFRNHFAQQFKSFKIEKLTVDTRTKGKTRFCIYFRKELTPVKLRRLAESNNKISKISFAGNRVTITFDSIYSKLRRSKVLVKRLFIIEGNTLRPLDVGTKFICSKYKKVFGEVFTIIKMKVNGIFVYCEEVGKKVLLEFSKFDGQILIGA